MVAQFKMQSLGETPTSYNAPTRERDCIISARCGQVSSRSSCSSGPTTRPAGSGPTGGLARRPSNSISSKRALCKYAPASSPAPLGRLVLLAALLALGASNPLPPADCLRFGPNSSSSSSSSSNPNSSHNLEPQPTSGGGSGKHHERRPQSSSSFLADIEDLTDSSVRTRLGTVNIEHLGNEPHDFDQLIERLVPDELQQQQQQQRFADANNKTSMRFFRNSKTFASIVYTNPLQAGQRQARKLINCHLVDMEKHASDVAIYEAKYDIRTIDIEFKEMMQLIEACTNIARLRRRPANGIGQQPGAPGSQYRTSGQQQSAAQPAVGLLGAPAQGALRPMIVVGRPVGSLHHSSPPASSSHSGSGSGAASGQSAHQQHQQQQQQQSASSKEQALFHQVMSSALQKEFSQLDGRTTRDDSPHLDLPQSAAVFTEMHNHHQRGINLNISLGGRRAAASSTTPRPRHQHQHRKRQHAPQKPEPTVAAAAAAAAAGEQQHKKRKRRGRFEPFPTPELYANLSRLARGKFRRQLSSMQRHPLVGALAKVSEQSKRLVLGEVTAPPSLSLAGSGAPNGSTALRDALQEISSYDTSDLLSIWRGILPGTNWCGMGDRATSYNDLGFESDIDICCRAHDFCPVRLSAFTSGYGLFNWSFYTRSHCWCDQNFLDCLQQAESPLSAVVMKFYFSIMKTTCLNDIETDQQQQQAHQPPAQQNSKQAPFVASGQVQLQHPAQPPSIPALRQSQWIQTTRQEPKQRP